MTANTPRPNQTSRARVVDISAYRNQQPSATSSEPPIERRKRLVRTALNAQIEDPSTPPLAIAMVLLRADGRLASIAEAIEPEQAPIFAAELELLAAKIRNHTRPPPRQRRQRGFSAIGTAISLTFMAATYINPNPLADAALSLAAQLVASVLARRHD